MWPLLAQAEAVEAGKAIGYSLREYGVLATVLVLLICVVGISVRYYLMHIAKPESDRRIKLMDKVDESLDKMAASMTHADAYMSQNTDSLSVIKTLAERHATESTTANAKLDALLNSVGSLHQKVDVLKDRP